MSLIEELNGIIRNDPKTFGGVSDFDFTTRTGFKNFDYLNGQIVTLDSGEKQLYTGLSNGRIVQIIGKSGTGKSTLAMQIGANIIQRYTNGLLYLFDFEQNNTKDRFRSVTGVSEDYYNQHCTILRDGIHTEAVLNLLAKIKEFKLAHESELLVDNENGIKDPATGKVIQVLPPTVVIIDSLAMMMPKEVMSEEEMAGSMQATAVAKSNTQFFKRAVQVCNKANIIILMVNHITQQIAIGVTPPTAVVNYLKQDEAISGGKAAMYVTDTLIKITASSKLEEDKLWGIKGFEAKIEICKSRHAPAGRSTNMIYDQTNGFRNDLSMLDYIKSCGALKGNGMAYYIDGNDQYKFKLSNFKEKFDSIPEFRALIEKTADVLMKASIKESDNIKVVKEEVPAEINAEVEDGNN